jgi:sulfite oxidase
MRMSLKQLYATQQTISSMKALFSIGRKATKYFNHKNFSTVKHIRKDHYWKGNDKKWLIVGGGVAVSSASSILLYYYKYGNPFAQGNHRDTTVVYAEEAQQLKQFTREEVSKHKTKETGVWVTYKNGVYDVTDFVDNHPGGDRIMLAAGSAIDPYWKFYAIHNKEDIYNLLEEFRIGDLKDVQQISSETNVNEEDPFKDEPERVPVLKVNAQKAFNAETPAPILTDKFITPNEIFFVRNHLPVPRIDPKKYSLLITGVGVRDIQLTLEDLKTKFPHYSVTTTMQCAGNRRSEMNAVKPVKGIDWASGAIGTAVWTGIRLRDVLQYAGLDVDNCINDPKTKFIQFDGFDEDKMSDMHYGASIPIEKAVDLSGDVILAFEMNGKEIPRDHGYPIRAIVPGYVGARNVKWLKKICVSNEESKSFWQQKDYRGLPPTDSIELYGGSEKSTPIQELPVQSSICDPLDKSTIDKDAESVNIRGYAWSGGGRDIVRVDITADEGRTWTGANLIKPEERRHNRAWAWTPFEAEVKLPKEYKDYIRICSKAVDASFNVQPEHVESIWNARGYLNNSWSCINLIPKKEDAEETDESEESN